MPRSLDLWYALSPGARAVYGLFLMVFLLLVVWWWQIKPITREQTAREQQRLVQQAALQASWRDILALKPPEIPHSQAEIPKAFSPLDFHTHDAQLIRWRPVERGGEMVLEAQWVAIPRTFYWLAERQMLTSAFSITVGENALRFVLQLESDDGG
ncbi:pilus assembly protein HofO [Phytobacter palmae]|nr:pilus assembly protein HofO [Phytobacter palmae]